MRCTARDRKCWMEKIWERGRASEKIRVERREEKEVKEEREEENGIETCSTSKEFFSSSSSVRREVLLEKPRKSSRGSS